MIGWGGQILFVRLIICSESLILARGASRKANRMGALYLAIFLDALSLGGESPSAVLGLSSRSSKAEDDIWGAHHGYIFGA